MASSSAPTSSSAKIANLFGLQHQNDETPKQHTGTTVTEQDKYAVSKDDHAKGAFKRPPTAFHHKIKADGSGDYSVEAGRYHLYVAWGCPWAHRTLLVRKIKGLEDVISLTVLGYFLEFPDDGRPYRGWPFQKSDPDPIHPEFEYLHDVYKLSDPEYPHKSITVPVLFDKKTQKIVNNESAEIIEMFNSEFNSLAKHPEIDLSPPELKADMEAINAKVYPSINDGVYRCGFAATQQAYESAFHQLFNALDEVELLLSKQRYLCGNCLTMSDTRFVTTLLRFDIVYHTHFKCNKKKISEYPNLWAYTRDIYQIPGVCETFNAEETKKHYYYSHKKINPSQIVAIGPTLDLMAPHGRDKQFGK